MVSRGRTNNISFPVSTQPRQRTTFPSKGTTSNEQFPRAVHISQPRNTQPAQNTSRVTENPGQPSHIPPGYGGTIHFVPEAEKKVPSELPSPPQEKERSTPSIETTRPREANYSPMAYEMLMHEDETDTNTDPDSNGNEKANGNTNDAAQNNQPPERNNNDRSQNLSPLYPLVNALPLIGRRRLKTRDNQPQPEKTAAKPDTKMVIPRQQTDTANANNPPEQTPSQPNSGNEHLNLPFAASSGDLLLCALIILLLSEGTDEIMVILLAFLLLSK